MQREGTRRPSRLGEIDPDIRVQHQEHLSYLKRVSTEGSPPLITRETAQAAWIAWIAWLAVWQTSGEKMPIPSACTGPDGVMFYSWDKDRHHLELEIFPDKDAEFFYRDRETGEFWGEEYKICGSLPNELAQYLPLFI